MIDDDDDDGNDDDDDDNDDPPLADIFCMGFWFFFLQAQPFQKLGLNIDCLILPCNGPKKDGIALVTDGFSTDHHFYLSGGYSSLYSSVAGLGYVGGTSQAEVQTVSAANAKDASSRPCPSAADGATEG